MGFFGKNGKKKDDDRRVARFIEKALKAKPGGRLSTRDEIYERDGGRCWVCGGPAPKVHKERAARVRGLRNNGTKTSAKGSGGGRWAGDGFGVWGVMAVRWPVGLGRLWAYAGGVPLE